MPVETVQSVSNGMAVSEVCPAKLRRSWHLRCEDTNGD
jgi:hypothetical protein